MNNSLHDDPVRDEDEFGHGLGDFDDPPPLTGPQRTELLRSLAAGHAPQKACLDAGVDPLAFVQAFHDDAAFAVALGRLEAVRSLNVLSVTYQKAISGAAADRGLYLKFRPPPPAPPADAERVELTDKIGDAEVGDLARALGEDDR